MSRQREREIGMVLVRRLMLGLVAALCAVGGAQAQAWPDRPVKMVVPYPAGGSVDVVGRILAAELSKSLGQQFVVENKAGASGNIGTDSVAKSPPDGTTLLMGSAAALSANPALYKQLPFDPAKDLAPISLIAIQPNILIVHPSVPAKSVAELIALAKAKPGTLNYGTSGAGGSQHMASALFAYQAQVDMVHVPYRGGAPASADLVAGQVQMIFQTSPEALPLMRNNQVKALAVTTTKRIASLPDLPTVAESGLPGYESRGWLAVLGPAGLPAPILERLHAELVKIVRLPEVRARLDDLGLDVVGSTPAELAAFMQSELKLYRELVAATKITVE